MLKKVIGIVLVVCVLAAAIHFIPWPKFYDHTLKGVELEYSIDGETTTLYAEPITEVTVELDLVQKHYLLSDMVLDGDIQMNGRTLDTIDVNRFDKAQMSNASLFPEDHVWENEVEELFGSTLVIEYGGSFMTIYSNYDMDRVLLQDWQNNRIYLLSTEPFDLEESISYFEQYDGFFFEKVVK